MTCFIFQEKMFRSGPVQGPPDQPLVVENCWPKKKTRLGGCRKKKTGPALDAVLDVVVQADPVLDAVLDVAVQADQILDVVVQADPFLDVVVKTEAKRVVEVQTEEPVCLGCAVERPSDRDVKRTKRMSVIIGRDENGTETDGTDWCHIFFTIFYESENEYRNSENKYKTMYYRKQIQTEYGMDTYKKWMITKNKGLLNHAENSSNSSKHDKLTLS
jgi:hypothetical protein